MFTNLVRTFAAAAAISFAALTGIAFADGGTHDDLMRVRAAMAPAWCPEADYTSVSGWKAASFNTIGAAPQGPADELVEVGTSFEVDRCVSFFTLGSKIVATATWRPTAAGTKVDDLDLADGQNVEVLPTPQGIFLIETITFQGDRKEMAFKPIGVHTMDSDTSNF